MKRLLALVVLGGVMATPAFAQSVPHSYRNVPPAYQLQGTNRTHVYGADTPQPRFRESAPRNPDFQLGNSEE
jgi:hypothetical protein